MDLGAIYENDLDNAEAAVEAYEKSGDWYFEDQAEAWVVVRLPKVALHTNMNIQTCQQGVYQGCWLGRS